MRILCLDPSAVFGWAHGDPFQDGPPISGVFKLPDAPVTKRLIALEAWAMDMIHANGITDLFIEQPFLPKISSFAAVTLLAGYTLFAGTAGTRCGCNVSTVELSSWRAALRLPTQGPKNVLAHPDYARFASRKSGLKEAKRQWVKDRAKDYARKMGCDPQDDNEGDACCIYFYKRMQILARQEAKVTKLDLFDGLPI